MAGAANEADWPLRRHLVCDTADVGEFADQVIASVGGRTVLVDRSGTFRAHGCVAALGGVSLSHGGCSTGVTIDFPELELHRLIIADRGAGHVAVGATAGILDDRHACIIAPGRASTLAGDDAHGFLTVRAEPAALARRITAITGRPPRAQHDAIRMLDTDTGEMQVLRALVRALCIALDQPLVPELLLGDIENALLTALIRTGGWTWSDDGLWQAKASEAAVHIAADYIDANIHRTVKVEELVAVTTVSARSLFRAFRKRYGMTPHAFAKQRRLQRARASLTQPTFMTTVTQVALSFGFLNAGHFTRDYQQAFGEKPSMTLRRARLAAGQ